MAKSEPKVPAQKPKIFVSCVTSEFAEARILVAKALSFIGYDVEYQDAFATGAGNLTDLLRDKIDACEGLIQIVGTELGAESPETHPRLGQLSYTQYEFLYANKTGKSTWVFFTPSEASEDGSNHSDSKDARQARYRDFLKSENHLRIPFEDNLTLENSVLKIRHEFEELRSEYIEFQSNLRSGQKRTHGLLTTLLAATPLVAIALGAFFYFSSEKQIENTKTLIGKTRVSAEEVTSAKHLVKEDLFLGAGVNIDYESGEVDDYILSVGPAGQPTNKLMLGASLELKVDGETPADLSASMISTSVPITNFNFAAQEHPRQASITVTDESGEVSETFEYKVDFEGAYEQTWRTVRRRQIKTLSRLAKSTIESYKKGRGIYCDAIDELPSYTSCSFNVNSSVSLSDILESATIEWPDSKNRIALDFSGLESVKGLVKTSNDRQTKVMFPRSAENLTISGMFTDGSALPKFSFETSPLRKRNNRWLKSLDADAPAVGLVDVAGFGGGEWRILPLVGSEVTSGTWSINGSNPAPLKRNRAGLFEGEQSKSEFVGHGKLALEITYNYDSAKSEVHRYSLPLAD